MAAPKKDPASALLPPLTRRQFIQSTAAGAAAFYMAPALSWGASGGKSRVVSVSHAGMIAADERVDGAVARQCIDRALLALTREPDIAAAWRRIFPDLKPDDTIGLKVNAVSRKCPTHPEIAYAIADSLAAARAMNPNNIIIWDQTTSELAKARYTPNQTDTGVRCYGTVEKFSVARWLMNHKQNDAGGAGWDDKAVIAVGGDITSRLTNIITQHCTYLINVPVLKDHGRAGITLSLKNHYGSIDNPKDCHDNFCNPYIARINAAPQIRDKTRLVVCDAAYGVYKGGPLGAPQWMPKAILAAVDPVALDYTGLQIINRKRRQNGLASVTPMAVHLQTAQSLGLGTCNPDHIDLQEAVLA